MATTTKFEINGVVDTSQPVLENISTLANASGVFVTWDPSTGTWSVIKNDVGTAVMNFNDSNIIGNINVSGSGINDMYNAVTIEYPHQDLRDTRDYIDLEIPSAERYPQELDNKLEIKLDCINNPVQAQLIASRELKQSRVDKIITFSTSYLGNGLSAGDLISVTSTMYAYTAKVFRIITIQEDDTDDSGIVYQITALEYDAGVYSTAGLVRKERNKKTGIVPKNANQVIFAEDGNKAMLDLSAGLLLGLPALLNLLMEGLTRGNENSVGLTPLVYTFKTDFISVTVTDGTETNVNLGESTVIPISGFYKIKYNINWGGGSAGTAGSDGTYKVSTISYSVNGGPIIEDATSGTGDEGVAIFEDHVIEAFPIAFEAGDVLDFYFLYGTEWPTALFVVNAELILIQRA